MTPPDDRRFQIDPELMTPEARLDEIVELLALASLRLAAKERGQKAPTFPTEKCLDCSANTL